MPSENYVTQNCSQQDKSQETSKSITIKLLQMKSNGKTLKANRKNNRIVLRGRTRGFYSEAMKPEGKGHNSMPCE